MEGNENQLSAMFFSLLLPLHYLPFVSQCAKYSISLTPFLNLWKNKILKVFSIIQNIELFHGAMEVWDSKWQLEECNFKDDLTAKKYDECNITLKTIRSDNANKLVFAHLNINSIRNKFEFLATQVKGKIDVLMISET